MYLHCRFIQLWLRLPSTAICEKDIKHFRGAIVLEELHVTGLLSLLVQVWPEKTRRRLFYIDKSLFEWPILQYFQTKLLSI